MEGHFTFDLENCGTEDSKAGGEKIGKGFKIGSAPRKRLADISNVQQKSKLMNLKQHSALLSSNDNVDKLYKENMTLMKLVADRNKLIELSGIELQKLRVNFQKSQQQNVQLAQMNSQMLAELNSGKDKLRVLQHELGCKNVLLHAIKFHREAVPANNAQAVESSSIDNTKNQSYDVSEKGQSQRSSLDLSVRNIGKDDDKRPAKTRRQSMRFKAGEPSPTQDLFEIDEAKAPVSSLCNDQTEVNCAISDGSALGKEEKGDNGTKFETQDDDKRPAKTRRQSMRFKAGEPRPTQDLFEIDEAKVPVSSLCNDQTEVNCAISDGSALGKEEKGDNGTKFETQENRRSSIGRPMRRAVEKVRSYKETPLNVKMRREK